MDSILPFSNESIQNKVAVFAEETTLSTPKEYAWDFQKNDFKLKDGKFQIVEGKEALKIWIYKALKTARLTYTIYSEEYGQDLETIIGQGYSKGLIISEARRLTIECLKVNKHISDIKDFKAEIDTDLLKVSFTAITDCGEVEIDNV